MKPFTIYDLRFTIANAISPIRRICRILFLLSAFQCVSFSAFAQLHDVSPSGKTVGQQLTAINSNFNTIEAGGIAGNSNLFILRTNGVGYDLAASNTFTLFARQTTPSYIEVTNIPVPPPGTNTACTNLAGPYYECPPCGFGIWTNACGYRIYYTNGIGDVYYTNAPVNAQLAVAGISNLHTLTVDTETSYSTAGTYVFLSGLRVIYESGVTNTNWYGAFYHITDLGGGELETNKAAWITFESIGGAWTIRKGVNRTSQTNLLGSWGGAGFSITAGAYSVPNGFNSRNFVPQYDILVTGGGSALANGTYSFYGSQDDGVVGLAGVPTWVFTNRNSSGWRAESELRALPPHLISTNTPAGSVSYYTLVNHTYTGYYAPYLATNPPPAVWLLPTSAYATNAITIVSPLPPNVDVSIVPADPPRLTYTTNGVCTYLLRAPQYWAAVDAMNLETQPIVTSALTLDGYGTASLILYSNVVKIIPQSDTAEWFSCP